MRSLFLPKFSFVYLCIYPYEYKLPQLENYTLSEIQNTTPYLFQAVFDAKT